jgi:hypothetical protein
MMVHISLSSKFIFVVILSLYLHMQAFPQVCYNKFLHQSLMGRKDLVC